MSLIKLITDQSVEFFHHRLVILLVDFRLNFFALLADFFALFFQLCLDSIADPC